MAAGASPWMGLISILPTKRVQNDVFPGKLAMQDGVA